MTVLQPPSGGCVLKHVGVCVVNLKAVAAAFGRLCVETLSITNGGCVWVAAAFGRLCVETLEMDVCQPYSLSAAAFGRLCVETVVFIRLPQNISAAAFGRLCVETNQCI